MSSLGTRLSSRFLCVVIPDFPTWAAQQSDPALLERDLLIYAGGRIVSASPAARQVGVANGWSLQRAQGLVPEAVSLSRSSSLEAVVWDGVLRSLNVITPYVESLRPGMALLDVEPASAVFPFLRKTGAHGGVADDRTTAELTAHSAVTGTLRALRPSRSISFLQGVPVDVLAHVGVSEDTIQRLHWFGWHHVGELRAATQKQLLQQFPEGELLYRYAQARDLRPVKWYTPPVTVDEGFEWEQPVCEPYEIEPVLDLLLRRAVSHLKGRCTQEMTIRIQGGGGLIVEQRPLREPMTDVRALRTVARWMLHSTLSGNASLGGAYGAGRAISRLDVQLGGLAQPRPGQGRLFGAERPKVQATLRMVERRFPGILCCFVMRDANAYLPERFASLEPLDLKQEAELSKEPSKRPRRSASPHVLSHRWSAY